MSIYKACDIRGRFGTELTVRHAQRLGQAVAALHKPERVIVGGDGRVSTPGLKAGLIQALAQGGCQVIDIGTVPTPAFYFARTRLGVEAGVQVTASHNPPGDNGFKIILGAMPITEQEMQALALWMENPPENCVSSASAPPGGVTQEDILEDYVLSIIPSAPDLQGMKVVIDCANGMAGRVARQVWERTGAEARYLLEEVNGAFPTHPPNPADIKNLKLLKQAVLENGADLGIAYDGDADRVIFLDERGEPVPNDKVIVIFAELALERGQEVIVYDQKCSWVVPERIRKKGGHPVMERSGHTFIKTTFLQHGAAYAGELSGHHFLRQVNGDDGLFASLVFARHLRNRNQPLSELAQSIPSYPITPDIRLPMRADDIQQLLADVGDHFAGKAQIATLDGIRLEFDDGWALVRPSVTEPVVSLRFEALDKACLVRIIRSVAAASALLSEALIARAAGKISLTESTEIESQEGARNE